MKFLGLNIGSVDPSGGLHFEETLGIGFIKTLKQKYLQL